MCSVHMRLFKHLKNNRIANICTHKSRFNPTENEFTPKSCLVMKKITRYEYEKQLRPHLTEDELTKFINSKGSDYCGLLTRHDEYHTVLDNVTEHIATRGINVKIVDRTNYTQEVIDWSDMVVTVGGDGTFLLAASKVEGGSKPVIGINSDPARSEGYLCLPKRVSLKPNQAIDRILNGKFKWQWRQRIRMSMSGRYSDEEPMDIHDQEVCFPEHRLSEHVKEHETHNSRTVDEHPKPRKTLPILALNEVFIGESLSARVSFYEIGVNESPRVKQKSSGLTVCTGTGSTSWFFNINNVSKQSVRQILSIANRIGDGNFNLDDELLIRKVTKTFNNSLTFNPSDRQMAYAIRDPVVNGVFSVNHARGFCQRMSVKSRMWDAWVVVDGGVSYPFNDGAVVDLEINDDDALRCVHIQHTSS